MRKLKNAQKVLHVIGLISLGERLKKEKYRIKIEQSQLMD
mgnify:CR=1 FL=1